MEFDFASRESKASAMAFVNLIKQKAILQEKKQPSKVVSGGNSLITRIKNIEALTQERLGHLADKFEVIKDRNRLKEYIDKAVANGIIAIDTETTGLNPIKDKLVGVCLYTPDEKPCYVPINHVGYVSLQRFSDQLTEAEVGEEMVRCKDLKCVFFNAKFDTRVMKNHLGFWCPIAWDGYIGAKLLDAEYEEEYNLKYLWAKYCAKDLNSPHYTFEKMFKGLNFALIPIETAYLYASNDAIITYELYEYQKELLDIDSPKCKELGYDKLAWVMKNIELPLIPVVAEMEETGVSIDKDYAKKLSTEYNAELDKINDKFLKEIDQYKDLIDEYRKTHPKVKLSDPLNVGSPAQISTLLWDILKIPNPIKKKQGKSDNEVLSAIDNPIAKIVLEYRTVSKLISTYIDKLPDEVVEKTGKIHASFNQYGAACVVGNSWLLTDGGLQKIENVVAENCKSYGDFYNVNCCILNKNREWETANKCIKYNNVNTVKLRCQYGFEIEGTPNHKVIISDITSDMWLKNHSEKQKRIFWDNKHFEQLDRIKVGDYIEVPCGWDYPDVPLLPVEFPLYNLKTHNNRDLIIPKYYDENFAELLGMYHADGSIKVTDGFTLKVTNGDVDVQDRFKYLIKKLFNAEAYFEKDKRANTGTSIARITHAKNLLPLFNVGATNKCIPEQIKRSNAKVIASYIRGMTLDSTLNRNRLRMTVCKKDDVTFMQMFLCSQGILSSVRSASGNYKNGEKYYHLMISGDFLNVFLDKIGVVQSRKNVRNITAQKHYSNVLIDKSFRVAVTEIEYGNADVYDIHVPETHSYLCASFINHNTGRFSSSDPNLQNIPSHDKKIRKMFVASSFDKVTASDEIELLLNDEVETERGRVKTQDLATGNIIKGENGNAKIIGIIRDSEDDRFFKVRIYHETPRFLVIVYRRYVMYSADFSQQEPGITSSLSDDPKMIGAFVEGKDIYATIASIAFNRDYLDCLGPENMPKDCGRDAHPEGKKYRGRAKAIVLGICYGKSIPSIAEDLGVTKQEAQEIYDKVMTSFVNLKKFMEDSQSFAHKYGYVETMYGRRRPIPDMQLDPYELKPSEEKYFDPFFDSEKFGVISVADKKMSRYKNELLKCKFYKAREDLKAKIFNDGFIVTDNTQRVEDATRQCVNCVDNQTEILTKSGWKKFNELFVGQEIMAINTVTGELECTRIEKLHQHWGKYQMLEYKDDYIDICCTENHRIPIKQIKDEDGYFLTFADASDVCGDTTFALQDNKLIEVRLPYNGFSKGKVVNFVWCVTTGTGTWIARRNGKIYITGNSRVQGSAADLSKMAMYGVGVSKELKKYYFRLLLMVHDEVIGESPEIFRAEVSKLLETIMVGACKDLKVPAHVDVDISYRWYENE